MIYFRRPACGIYHESVYQVPRITYEARKRPGAGDLELRDECPNTGYRVACLLSDTQWRDSA